MVAPIMHIRHGNKFRLHHRQSASQLFFCSIWTPTLMRCYQLTSKLKACATHEQCFKYSATGHEPWTWQTKCSLKLDRLRSTVLLFHLKRHGYLRERNKLYSTPHTVDNEKTPKTNHRKYPPILFSLTTLKASKNHIFISVCTF